MDKRGPQPEMIERIVPWTLNGEAQPSFLCTPDALEELAAGHLLAQGRVDSIGDVARVLWDGQAIAVQTHTPPRPQPTLEARLASLRPVQQRLMRMAWAVALARELADVEHYYGTHCLALCRLGGEPCFREDIGRHNALDKVIGWGAMQGIPFADCAIAATGRISLEMLLKAATVGIANIISKKYPSDLSVSVARQLGIAIIGKALSEQPIVYA